MVELSIPSETLRYHCIPSFPNDEGLIVSLCGVIITNTLFNSTQEDNPPYFLLCKGTISGEQKRELCPDCMNHEDYPLLLLGSMK